MGQDDALLLPITANPQSYVLGYVEKQIWTLLSVAFGLGGLFYEARQSRRRALGLGPMRDPVVI